ncbi:MAG: Phosphoglycolate phosphatase [Turneriella sp.]|nr:Phosphoglycolate phosphatase [Turneriella sp.]
MPYSYFALDIDGTIFSSESIIYPVYKEAIENYCNQNSVMLAVPTQESIMLEIGKPVKKIFENLFPQLKETERDKISDSILVLLAKTIREGGGEYYEGIAVTVDKILAKGGKILVASNGRKPYIDAILGYLGILKYISQPTYIDGVHHFSKGDILKAYVQSGISARSILMVGDRLSDLDAARTINCDFAWCAYGHAPVGEITEYEIRLDKFADLAQYA